MKFLKRMYYRMRCVTKMDHGAFTLFGSSFELKTTGKKYYYFKNVKSNKYVKVLKKENGEELLIYRNWLKD